MEKDYTLLVIDDEAPMHLMLNNLLRDEYNVVNAKTAQQGIDILSEKPIHFILSDIHMPGMSGLEFLESLTADAEHRNIPILIMTSLPTVDKEQKALGLGAADFIDKALFNTDKDELLNRIRMKMVANVDIPDLPEELVYDKKEITKSILFEISSGDFVTTTQKLTKILGQKLNTDHLSFWTINNENVQMLLANGIQLPRRYGPKELKEEATFKLLLEQKRPYLVNNVFTSQKGILPEMSRDEGLPAEIGIPLFALTEKELIENKMKIPPKTPLFGYVVLKRKKVFTSKEYKLTSMLLMQMGTILWRLYHDL
ncbi:MAG: response regulator [Gracilimonas sp.]|uniref:response regulator n=1 Tax=Gracilimonas sp. TaxID=1974203 RepID=UPI00199BCBB4|nr:response regulator [Gracilimonas sp.]MBD3617037.1 response regulator [Gracilimonas sp.]